MPDLRTSRDDLKKLTFRITEVREQLDVWKYGNIQTREMPPGCFVTLDPPIGKLKTQHCAVGLKVNITSIDGTIVSINYDNGALDSIGRMILFFAGRTEIEFRQGSIVRLSEV